MLPRESGGNTPIRKPAWLLHFCEVAGRVGTTFRETRNSRLTPVNGSGLLLPRFTCYMRCLGATAALVFGNRAIRRGGELWGSTFKWQSAQSGQVWA